GKLLRLLPDWRRIGHRLIVGDPWLPLKPRRRWGRVPGLARRRCRRCVGRGRGDRAELAGQLRGGGGQSGFAGPRAPRRWGRGGGGGGGKGAWGGGWGGGGGGGEACSSGISIARRPAGECDSPFTP